MAKKMKKALSLLLALTMAPEKRLMRPKRRWRQLRVSFLWRKRSWQLPKKPRLALKLSMIRQKLLTMRRWQASIPLL